MTVTTTQRTGIASGARRTSRIPGIGTLAAGVAASATLLVLSGCANGYLPPGTIYSRLPPGSNGAIAPAPVFVPDAVATPTPVPYQVQTPLQAPAPIQPAPLAPARPVGAVPPASALTPAPVASVQPRQPSAAEIAKQRMDRYNEIDRKALEDQDRAYQADDAIRQAEASAPVYYNTWTPAYTWYEPTYGAWYEPAWTYSYDSGWRYHYGYRGYRPGVFVGGGWGW